MTNIPVIKEEKGIATLYVKDKPFFARSGEIHNSSSSNLEYMKKAVWPQLKDLNMNAVIVPIYWQTVEETEGVYDFALLHGLIMQARENDMHLILLWFGLWKNGESMYVPSWMKKDTDTYWRVKKTNGDSINTISPLCEAAVEKDAKAFAKIMAYIKEIDEQESTVVFVQVENEIGLLGTERDYSIIGNELFKNEIPEQIGKEYGTSGDWKQAFLANAEEYFMAYYFAKAVETITAAGRREYPIPCYTNAWLRQHPWHAGSYPSGGPVKEVHKIWKQMAPSLFTLAPDIYVPYVPDVLDEYCYAGNPLVVPEVRKDAVTASYCLYAFGKHNAICYSPFGIEDLGMSPDEIDKPPMEMMIALNIDPSAFDIAGSKAYLAKTYDLIKQMQPLLMQYRGTNQLQSYVKKSETDYGNYFRFRAYDIAVSYTPRTPQKPVAAGIIFELEEDRFLVVGTMSSLTFRAKAGENKKVDFLRLEEGELVKGEWKAGRILNGDEKMVFQFRDMPSCYCVELYKYG